MLTQRTAIADWCRTSGSVPSLALSRSCDAESEPPFSGGMSEYVNGKGSQDDNKKNNKKNRCWFVAVSFALSVNPYCLFSLSLWFNCTSKTCYRLLSVPSSVSTVPLHFTPGSHIHPVWIRFFAPVVVIISQRKSLGPFTVACSSYEPHLLSLLI